MIQESNNLNLLSRQAKLLVKQHFEFPALTVNRAARIMAT